MTTGHGAMAGEPPTQDDDTGNEPVNAMEQSIAAIWSELLGVSVPGTDVSFFRLGGHSLLVARLSTRLEEDFGAVVPLADLFTHETVAQQVSLLERLFAEEVGNVTDEELSAVLGEMLQ
jgi:acyl carrier protein